MKANPILLLGSQAGARRACPNTSPRAKILRGPAHLLIVTALLIQDRIAQSTILTT